MKWYGLKSLFEKNLFLNKLKKKKLYNIKKNLFFKSITVNISPYSFYLYIPYPWNFLLIEFKSKSNVSNLLYFYSSAYYFFIPVSFLFLNFSYNKLIGLLSFVALYTNNYIGLFWKKIKNVFYSFNKIFFKKIKFKGKGYYIYKNFRNTIALQFGYSHIKRVYLYSVYVKFLTKTSILIFGLNWADISLKSKILFNTRPINIFTGKGMRFTRQIIYRKTGKVSSYR